MEKNLAFNISTYTCGDSAIPKPDIDNYNYWISLINYYLKKADTIEIHCWNEEIETIEELDSLNLEMVNEENITIFKGKKTPVLSNYLLNSYMNKFRECKWFTVNLESGMDIVMHSGHWGTEFVIPNPKEKDIQFIKSVVPPETSFEQHE
ncbi:hypothetical protein M3204_22910 [Mesobacillus subterraneus]|uniref:hypothetical protein n=1 Tax=Mesobacillus subterraneus TaxID=285983 RepID=UPI00203FB998|nr:hypothetical protein [Mesobacillus subterraneus]MCM3667252.1 hypothetical protein [Mesobacillus subterraneus]MCM3686185.1 hypothetical protein [Mesobacillus subterraneus]